MKRKELKLIGWREWVSLPDLGIERTKAKVDTGARTSSLHAFDMKIYTRAGKDFVKFNFQAEQDSAAKTINCKAKVIDYRNVKSSNGQVERRPVILTTIRLLEEKWLTEITLTNRDEMGFRMLFGRASIKNKFLVDAGKSFYGNRKKKKIRSSN